MNTRSLIWLLIVCSVAMVVSLNQWMPFGRGTELGATAFVLSVLSICSWVLRVAASKKRGAPAFFTVGAVLLFVGLPAGGVIVGFFVAPGQNRGTFAPAEMIFGLMGLACIFKSWLLWADFDRKA
jgi:hypothetical protein